MARALEARGFARAAAAGALDKLAREGWLDDLAAARTFVRSRARRYGRSRIERELSLRGFSRETIAQVLPERGASEESETLSSVFQRLERTHARLPLEKRRQKIRTALLRRGFAADEVSEIMKGSNEVVEGDSGDIP
ncbi:MAG TPA: regulatory protein RecX [Thermoanaerobaculia bacterium]